jgi:DNA adenine methylase
MSFFRYPGGKSKIWNVISQHFNEYIRKGGIVELREPFFGGGSVGTKFLSQNHSWEKIWINDFDKGISDLWTSVIKHPEALKEMVMNFKPSIEAFDQFKLNLTSGLNMDTVECGFEKLAIHQISYSGLGTKSGGPLGGRKQASRYKIDCRWSPEYICRKIDLLHKRFSTVEVFGGRCTCLDFEEVILAGGKDTIIYLDPPYYHKGGDLYQHGFSASDHIRLAEALRKCDCPWVLSYDDCQEIRDLYWWSNIDALNVNYSITGTKNEDGERSSRIKPELLIYA